MILFFEIMVLLVLLALSALFSGSETAFFSLSPLHRERLSIRRDSGAQKVVELLKTPSKLLVGILSGNMLVNIAATVLITALLNEMFPGKGAEIAVLIMTFILLFFGEITPKVIAAKWNIKFSTSLATILKTLLQILRPISIIAEKVSAIVGQAALKDEKLTEADLRMAIDILRRGNNLNPNVVRALLGALELDRLKILNFIVPKEKWKIVSPSQTVGGARSLLKKIGDIVVIMDRNAVLGIVDASMLVGKNDDIPIQPIGQTPLIISQETEPSAYIARAFASGIMYSILLANNGDVIGLLSLKKILGVLISEEFFGKL